jgi:hypothetical protein
MSAKQNAAQKGHSLPKHGRFKGIIFPAQPTAPTTLGTRIGLNGSFFTIERHLATSHYNSASLEAHRLQAEVYFLA